MHGERRGDGWVGTAALVLALAGTLFLVVPLLVIFPMAFSTSRSLAFPPPGYSLDLFGELLGSPAWRAAILTSAQVGVVAAAIATCVGVPAAYAIARHDFPGKRALYALLLTPLVFPVIIVALSLFLTFAPLHLTGNRWAVAVGHSLLGIPFVIVVVTTVLRESDVRLEHAARSLGASPWRAFAHVTLPQIRSGILTGAFFAFAVSWDEVVMVVFVGGQSAMTLPLKIWGGITTSLDPVIPAVAALLLTPVLLAFGALGLLERRAARRP
ncbi:MAG: ABC transporter permease [Actinobacteria bacterium]|nr:ABC transporter permease [Actinomycetota bacterium]